MLIRVDQEVAVVGQRHERHPGLACDGARTSVAAQGERQADGEVPLLVLGTVRARARGGMHVGHQGEESKAIIQGNSGRGTRQKLAETAAPPN